MVRETRNRRWEVSVGILLVALGVLLLVGLGTSAIFIGEWDKKHDHELKVQQSYDNSMIDEGEAIQMSEISESEHRALYEAFKESEHFLHDGTAVDVSLDEKSELLESGGHAIVPVESNGVIIVVAITYDGTSSDLVSLPYALVHALLLAVSFSMVMIGFLIAVAESPHNRRTVSLDPREWNVA